MRPATTRSESMSEQALGDLSPDSARKTKTEEKGDSGRGFPLSDLPEWWQEFRENLLEERVPEHRDTPASSSRELSKQPVRKEVPGRHSIHTHFPNDRNCEICKKTKFIRAPCRRRMGEAVPRADTWWLGNGRSHGSQWRMWFPKQLLICCHGTRFGNSMDSIISVWNKNFAGPERCLRSSPGRQKSFTLTIPLNLAKLVKSYSGIIVRQHLIGRRQMALLPSKFKQEERFCVVYSGASTHMTSREGLNTAELETVTMSRCPTTVITANGEVQKTWRGHSLRQRIGYILDFKKSSRIREQYCRSGKLCEDHGYPCEWPNGQKTCLIKNGVIRRTTYQSWSWVYRRLPPRQAHQHLRHHYRRKVRAQHLFQHHVKVRMQLRGGPLFSEIPEWLKEFRENLVDESVPEPHDLHASSLHEPFLEPLRQVVPGKHTVYTHLPKDGNCKICQRTKITRAPCRRRTGSVVPRAKNVGDLITADDTILSEGCESRKQSSICSCGARLSN